MYCEPNCNLFFTGRMPRSGKLPVLNLLAGQKSGFSARRGDSLHRFSSNLAGPTGTWVRLPAQNLTSIATGGRNSAPKYQNFHFLIKSRPALTDYEIFFMDIYTTNYPTLVFKFPVIRITGYGVIAEKPRVGKLGQIFPCTL